MNILGIGNDIIEIKRIKKACQNRQNFLEKIFTEEEINYFSKKNNPYQTIAGHFAAKEAVVKALGTGFRGFKFIDIEIVNDKFGKPSVNIKGDLKIIFNDLKIKDCMLTISHCKDYATAMAIITIEE